ncbi:oligosaccharide flippase family protein [Peribacillus frigoritolerans]|uniref:oligosaccharide flippase family protein n=1 Tax=Peribacillus frigoritolerans TaxID=450367 RepID=UPI001F4F928B|nr:lipopolysaccharide biosynthesis protein [Peribacillus frigoritolerans]MCK2016876.1 lipopolysaccharide biosynthesis protein [Peribacillus frigoritolerans]
MLVNVLSTTLAFVINIGITFILTPYIVTKLGSEAYSFISISNTFISIASIVTIALNSMASRFISIEINANRFEKANEYYSSVFIANIALTSALSIPSVVCVIFLNYILNIPSEILTDVRLTFIFVFINILVSVVGNVFAVATFAKNRLDLSSIRLIEGNLIRGIVTIGLFLFFEPRIYFVTLTTLIVSVFTIISNIHYTKKLLPEIKLSIQKFSLQAIKTLLSSGIWNSLNQLSNVLLSQLDLLIANILVGAVAGGQYAIANTISSFMLTFISMLTSVFIPKFTILYAKNNNLGLVSSITSSMKILAIIITLPIGFLLVFGDVFFGLWIPGENIPFIHLLSQITLISLIISVSGNMIFNIYTITNNLKIPALFMLVSGIFKTLLISIILIIGNVGVVIIPVVSAIVNIVTYFTFMPIYASKCLNVEKGTLYSPIIKSMFCTLTMVVICILTKKIFDVSTWIQLFIAAGACAVIALAINFLLIFSKKERKDMIHQLVKN